MTSPGVRLGTLICVAIICFVSHTSARSHNYNRSEHNNAPLVACTWTGSLSTDWANPGNWSGCGVSQPQAGDTVTVGSATNQPTITTTAPSAGELSTITVNSGGKITVATDGILNTNSGAIINAGGEIAVTGGTFNLGTTTELDLVYATGSTITLADGALNITGGLHGSTTADTTTYNQSGGTVTVAIVASTNPTFGAFDIRDAGSSFTMSNGEIIHSKPSNTTDFRLGAATNSVTGGTLQFGNAGTPGGSFFEIRSSTPIFNLTLASTGSPTVSVRESALVVRGDVTIPSLATLQDFESLGLSVGGNWSNSETFNASLGTVTFNGSSNQNIGGGNITTFNNLTINNPAGVTLTQSCFVDGTLTLTSGNVTTGFNSLTINSTGSASRTSGHVIGNLKKIYEGVGSFRFEVGTANGYSPVDTNVTAGSGDLTVAAVQGPQPSVAASASLQRYWTLTTDSGITADLVFHYLDPTDIMGNESNYRIIRVTGVTPVSFPNDCESGSPCVDTDANTATINGVSNFSDWTVGEPVGPTAADGVVSGRITRNDGMPVAGAVVRLNGTQSRKTITDENGAYRFDSVETNGFYIVTPSRANYFFAPVNRSFSQLGVSTEAVFTGLSIGDIANPLDTPEFYVRQQYLDLLGREPEEEGFNYWSDRILECGSDLRCTNARRRAVAAAFFVEREFQETGYFVYRLYKASFGNRPTFAQYLPDRNRVIGGADLDTARRILADDFTHRLAFKQAYLDTLSNEEFVNKLCDTAGIFTDSIRQTEINKLDNGGTRSQVLLDIIEDVDFKNTEYNTAFVATEYFAYLRRDPEQSGYDFWLYVMNNREPGNYSGMVCAFITSTEYQKRFCEIVSHGNAECGR